MLTHRYESFLNSPLGATTRRLQDEHPGTINQSSPTYTPCYIQVVSSDSMYDLSWANLLRLGLP
jgi:hypothetical protein